MSEFYKNNNLVGKQSSFMGRIIFENDSQEDKTKSQSLNVGNQKEIKDKFMEKLF